MIVTDVYKDGQLLWADAVPCEKSSAGYAPKSSELSAPFDSPEALQICFLNEDRVRRARYEVLHYRIPTEYYDDGPPALDQIVEACRLVEEGLKAQRQVVVYVPDGADRTSHRRFSALCVAAHRVLARGATAAEAAAPWQEGGSSGSSGIDFFAHSWASRKRPAPARALTMEQCLEAIEVACKRGWLDLAKFDASSYLDLWKRYDVTWLVPGELQVMGDPVSTVNDPNPETIGQLEPKEGSESFVSYFQENGVKLIVRLNQMSEPGLRKSYDSKVFTKYEIGTVNGGYDDVNGGVPTNRVLGNIIAKCNEASGGPEKAAVAFHCKAGFGRSVVCAASWLVYHHDLPGRVAFSWSRLCRPGSITTQQQATFLQDFKGKAGVEDKIQAQGCCTLM
mmetsp:Transcript_113756/g.332227  ORF Transcript_113756/g.332227 Transcript_113756/m.332227 type:complete len:393 (-) Transcript_113756:149-1327(-)